MQSPTASHSGRLVLASRSPRRIELLREAGYEFDIDPADIDEEDYPKSLDPIGVARFLALRKAVSVADRRPDSTILSADTVVTANGKLYGKAETPDEARKMLVELIGNQEVITGVAVINRSRNIERVDHATSTVHLRAMSPEELDQYVDSGEWRGKAGAYGIQDVDPESDPFVRIVSGEYTNVVGLPIELVKQMVRDLVQD